MGIFIPISTISPSATRNGSDVTITSQVTLGPDAAPGQVITFSLSNGPSSTPNWTHTVSQAEYNAGSLTDVHVATIDAGNYTETTVVVQPPNTGVKSASLSVP